jgi:hypothetical protein
MWMLLHVLEEEWFSEVEALRIDEFWVRIWKQLALAHFEEAIDDEDKFWEIGGKSSTKDNFLTFATNFWTEVPAREHSFWNCSWPN